MQIGHCHNTLNCHQKYIPESPASGVINGQLLGNPIKVSPPFSPFPLFLYYTQFLPFFNIFNYSIFPPFSPFSYYPIFTQFPQFSWHLILSSQLSLFPLFSSSLFLNLLSSKFSLPASKSNGLINASWKTHDICQQPALIGQIETNNNQKQCYYP